MSSRYAVVTTLSIKFYAREICFASLGLTSDFSPPGYSLSLSLYHSLGGRQSETTTRGETKVTKTKPLLQKVREGRKEREERRVRWWLEVQMAEIFFCPAP